MRLCICGLHREGAVKKAEKVLNVESVNINYPGLEDNEYKFFHYAAETFKYFNKKNIIFDGGIFDDVKLYSDSGWADLQEQIIFSVIGNVDNIIIITEGMDEKIVDFCKSFKELYPDKFLIINNESEFDIK